MKRNRISPIPTSGPAAAPNRRSVHSFTGNRGRGYPSGTRDQGLEKHRTAGDCSFDDCAPVEGNFLHSGARCLPSTVPTRCAQALLSSDPQLDQFGTRRIWLTEPTIQNRFKAYRASSENMVFPAG